jgi:putative tryptophan/tyrosine transport system substrate-binding protein
MRLIGLAVILTVSLILAPLAAKAQPPVGKTVGYLSFRSGPSYLEEAFRQGLRELGYFEGQNISIEYRWADFKPDRAATLAAELVRLNVNIIVSTGGPSPSTAAKRATKTIPIVFTVANPVGIGLVASLNRPGGNMTGINVLSPELDAKRLDLLKELVPGISRVGVLANPANAVTAGTLKDLDDAARALRLKLHILEVRERQGIDDAFTAMARERDQAVLVTTDPMLLAQRERIVDMVTRHRLPAIFGWREFPESGGLLSYDAKLADMYRRLATYVDKIFRGAKPGDLPIEQPMKFELIINLKTAKSLGLTIPPSVLLRADQIIE